LNENDRHRLYKLNMKANPFLRTLLILVVFLILLTPAQARYVVYEFPDVVNSNSITVLFTLSGEVPEWMAILVSTNTSTGIDMLGEHPFDHAHWIPFQKTLLVDLGPGEGKRHLRFAFRYKGLAHCDGWSGADTEVRTTLPIIAIYAPPEGITFQPVIKLKGYTSQQAQGIKYLRANQAGQIVSSGEGLVNDQHFDPVLSEFTTNYFTCYDVALDPGTNTFFVSAEDFAGNHFKSKHVIVFTTAGDTNPPNFKIDWPMDGMCVSGSNFEIRGPCDDPTAKVTVLACNDEGKTTHEEEPSDHVPICVEYIPLDKGYNYITVIATDVAGNTSLTNLVVAKSSITLTSDSPKIFPFLSTGIVVTGYCSDTNCTVYANGVKAIMKPDGHWIATNVPSRSTLDLLAKSDGADTEISQKNWLPTICGAPMGNSLQAGLSMKEVGTNEYNHYQVDLGFTNSSGGGIPRLTWMLPREEARYSLHLFDQTNHEVARQEWTGKQNQPLTTNLNIHHLGKNEVAQIDGIIPFQTNSTFRFAALNLDQHFLLPPPGDYHLEVVERLYRIAPDGQLIPVEFPPITTAITIVDQPSEMCFYLNALQQQGKLAWGAERNSLRVGVAHGLGGNLSKTDNLIEIFVQNTSTNDCRNLRLRLPKPEERFDMMLYDASGKEVSKTELGKKQGTPLSLDGKDIRGNLGLFGSYNHQDFQELRSIFFTSKDATECGRFNLNDYFEIKAAGQYQLTYQQHFYQWNTNGILTGVIQPKVTVLLTVTNIQGY
jgi:hypothetical protein